MKTEIQKMQEEIEERIKNKPEEIEYGFGIQKFDNAADAFKMMDTAFGDENESEYYHNVYIGNEAFTCKIINQVIMFYYLAKTGAIPEEQFESGLMLNGTKTDELLSFNFFIYNEKNNCYYASLMEDWEDDKALLSKRQWDIYHEIWEAYNMDYNLRKIVSALDNGVKEDFGDKPLDETFFELARNKWLR